MPARERFAFAVLARWVHSPSAVILSAARGGRASSLRPLRTQPSLTIELSEDAFTVSASVNGLMTSGGARSLVHSLRHIGRPPIPQPLLLGGGESCRRIARFAVTKSKNPSPRTGAKGQQHVSVRGRPHLSLVRMSCLFDSAASTDTTNTRPLCRRRPTIRGKSSTRSPSSGRPCIR